MKLILSIFVISFALTTQASLSPLKFIEKSSYKLSALTKTGQAHNSFLSQTEKVRVQRNSSGATVVLFSRSLNNQDPNTLTMLFDVNGKMTSAQTHFTTADSSYVVFTKANADEILDEGPEYIIDHLQASPEHPYVAEHTTGINFTNENGKIIMDILLDDAKTYRVMMDLDGRLISKGMLP